MKQVNEMTFKINSDYVKDNYIQIMLSYHNYLMLFGNNSLMYFKNLISPTPIIAERSVNTYLNDMRRNNFPYSQIPEHVERVSLSKKVIFINQILDFEKTYILIKDGFIIQLTAYKDGQDALVHSKILNDQLLYEITKKITINELQSYFKTGSIKHFDKDKYDNTVIFDINGYLCNPIFEVDDFDDILEEIGQLIIPQIFMVKWKSNGELKIDSMYIKMSSKEKIKITLANLYITKEKLSVLKSRAELLFKESKEPNISLSLNSNIFNKTIIKRKK